MINLITSFNLQNYLVLLIPITLVSGSFFLNLNFVILIILFIYQLFLKKIDIRDFNKLWIKLSLIFLIYQIFSSIYNGGRIDSLVRALSYSKFLILSLSIYLVFMRNKKYFKYFLFIFLFVNLFINIDANIQHIFKKNLFGNVINDLRLTSIFGDEKIVGSFLTKTIFLILPLFYIIIKKKLYREIAIYSFLILNFYTTLISGERMAFLLNLLGVCIFVLVNSFKNNKKFLISLLIFFIVIISVFIQDSRLLNRYKEIADDRYGLTKELNIKNSVWGAHFLTAIEIYKNNVFFGIGPKNFRVESCKQEYSKIDSTRASERCTTHPHNILLELISELGTFGFVIFLLIILSIFKNINIKNNIIFPIYLSLLLYVWPIGTSGSIFTSWNGTYMWIYIGLIFFLEKNYNK
jgi:O-antigen ligase